jgi:hypothetical protein
VFGIAPRRQLHPAREAVAVDGSDRRFPGIEAGEPERAGEVSPEMVGDLVHPAQIHARAERLLAGAGDHQDVGVVIACEAGDRLREPDGHLPAQTVMPRRIVEHHDPAHGPDG